jgi:hypothetical protein
VTSRIVFLETESSTNMYRMVVVKLGGIEVQPYQEFQHTQRCRSIGPQVGVGSFHDKSCIQAKNVS